jgi:hypothetical protein
MFILEKYPKYTVKKVAGNNLIIPGQGKFGKCHPDWGRENR